MLLTLNAGLRRLVTALSPACLNRAMDSARRKTQNPSWVRQILAALLPRDTAIRALDREMSFFQ